MDDKLFVFPPKKTLIRKRDCSIGQSNIVLQYAIKAKYRLSFGKFSGMKFFHPSVRLGLVPMSDIMIVIIIINIIP